MQAFPKLTADVEVMSPLVESQLPTQTQIQSASPAEVVMGLLSIAILLIFVASLVKWITLLVRGRRLFGPAALVPVQSRVRPYWNATDALLFYGFVIVMSIMFVGAAQLMGWMDSSQGMSEAIADSVNQAVEDKTGTPVVVLDSTDDAPEESIGGMPEAEPISVVQLLISSASMLGATACVMAFLLLRRPSSARPEVAAAAPRMRPRVGWIPGLGDISLGVKAAFLILPPTMLMMGLVSLLQEYSHPVLEALKPQNSGEGPNYRVFAALFFTTAIVTPLVEEFWFRGLLQGGLQRLADARTDAAKWAAEAEDSTPLDNESVAPVEVTFGDSQNDPSGVVTGENADMQNPYLTPRHDPRRTVIAGLKDPDTRSDWTPTAIWPMVVASLLFAVMHWGQGLAPIPLFFLSLGMGYLYRQTGSLVPSIVVHFVLNGFTMCASFLEMMQT